MDVRRETATEAAQGLAPSYGPELEKLVEREERISSIAAEVAHLRDELARLRRESEVVERSLDDRQAELVEKERSLTRLEQECASAEAGRARAQASLVAAETLLEGSRGRESTLEHELGLLRARIAESERLESQHGNGASEALPSSHLRLVALPSGYSLSESTEPPPRVGALVELDGRRFSVLRVGRSPLPLDVRPCALLVLEPERLPEPCHG